MSKTNTLSQNDFDRLIKQAGLTLSDTEKKKILPQLTEALDSAQVLNELDTSSFTSLTSVSGLINIMRQDKVTPSLPLELALGNAQDTHQNYFVVPSIFETHDN